MSVWYTLVITSCDRHALLKQTLDSLIAINCGGQKPRETIIVEDSPAPMPEWLRENIHYYSANLGTVKWLANESRRGHIYSVDRAYAEVKTDYILHWEDDFVATRSGWLQASADILLKYPAIHSVSLRGKHCNGHPLVDMPPFEGFKVQMPGWHGFGSFSFNPGLRRLSDYKKIGSYGKHTAYGQTGLSYEKELSKLYLGMDYRIAALPSDNQESFVEHIGGTCSRAADSWKPSLPKILIAIPVCHAFNYGKWESGDSPQFNPANAYNGQAYGTGIHISGVNDRIQALRDTWLKDVAKFNSHVTYKLFYGTPHNRAALDDEVFLNVPDDYGSLPQKTIAICKYAKDNNYDLVYKCDDDTGVYVDRVIHEGLSGMWDYAGYLNGKVATGGTGYWLSKRAINIIAEHASQNHWAEDVAISKALFNHNIQGVHLEGHRTGRADHWFFKDGFDASVDMSGVSAFHAVQPAVMRDWYEHKENGRGNGNTSSRASNAAV